MEDSECVGTLTRKNLQIRLLGHCIICLRKVSLNRNARSTSLRNSVDGDSVAPKIAPKSVVTSPGFLITFNQVWAVLQTIWKINDGNVLSEEIGISLESALQTGYVSTNVSFSKVPTICEVCCDKVLTVENLMKAVRQQVREISMLLKEGRRRHDGGLGSFEKSLRENELDESLIKATLQFVGILDDFYSTGLKNDEESAEAEIVANKLDQDYDKDNSLTNSQIYSDDSNEGQTGGSGDEDGDGDPDYVNSEEELEEEDDDESEEKMEVEDEDKNDPDFREVKNDPLAFSPKKRKMDSASSSRRWANKFTSSDDKKGNPDKYKFICTCGKIFGNRKALRQHMRRSKSIHPEYEPWIGTTLGNRQLCELCGEWVMHSEILEHLTGVHLNGQAEWVIRCFNERCPYMYVSSKKFQWHFHKENGKECKIIWKGKGGPVCETCGFKGTNMLKIWNHVRDKHEVGIEKNWKCPISGCEKMFCVKQSVQHHMYEHRYRPPITEQICDKCGGNFKVEEMEEHLKGKHGIEEVIGCKQCELRFSGKDEMVEHVYEHRGIGIRCDICDAAKFGKYSDFREHYWAVHKLCPKKFKCGEGNCEIWFWRKETKEDHELRMHKESNVSLRYRETLAKGRGQGKAKEFECDVCQVKFVKEDVLISHKIRMHGADPYTCEICGDTFEIKYLFNRHKKEHAGIVFQKEWKCEVEGCGKIFKAQKLWKHHVETGHEGQRPHVCEICGKGYAFRNGLRTHRDSVHLGLRPYVCDECGERFSYGQIFKKHKLIHTGERPFGCEICGQRFRHKGVLATHIKGHQEKGNSFKPNGPMKKIRKRKDL